jgi:hypothetical protein
VITVYQVKGSASPSRAYHEENDDLLLFEEAAAGRTEDTHLTMRNGRRGQSESGGRYLYRVPERVGRHGSLVIAQDAACHSMSTADKCILISDMDLTSIVRS